MKLTVKQRKFADEYIDSGKITQSAIKAGYAKRSAHSIGSENLQKPAIKSYINKKLDEIESAKIMDATEGIELLSAVARGQTKETVILTTADGRVVERQKSADLKTRITAVKEILKRYPDSNKLVDAQVRKLEAEADIAEAKANDVKNAQSGKDSTLIVDDLGDVDDDD